LLRRLARTTFAITQFKSIVQCESRRIYFGWFATGVKRARHIDAQAAGYSQLKLDLWRSHLDAYVDAPVRRWLPSHIEFENEVLVGLFCPKVMALLRRIVFADEHLVLNMPEFCGTLSLEIGQVLASEERHKLGLLGDASDGDYSRTGSFRMAFSSNSVGVAGVLTHSPLISSLTFLVVHNCHQRSATWVSSQVATTLGRDLSSR